MATNDNIRRYSDKTQIEMGTAETNLSGMDIVPLQHTSGDNKDYSLPLNYIQAIPVGSTSTVSGTATKVVSLSNYPSDYTPVVGSKILVKFTNANTATTQIYLTVGTVTKPCTVKGFALKSAIPANTILEFTYTGEVFNCQDFAISSVDTSTLQPVNSSAVNGALAELGLTTIPYYVGDSYDLDTMFTQDTKSTIAYVTGVKNAPDTDWLLVRTYPYPTGSNIFAIQECTILNQPANKKWLRHLNNREWSKWEQVTTSSVLTGALANYSRVTLLNFGNNTTVSISLTPKHAYRMTMGHPLIQNKKGYYDIFFLSNTEYKINNLSTDNNYTFSVSNNTLTITTSSSYGFVYVEDLGSWG